MDIFAEPLIDVPVGKTSIAESADLSDWNKMTLKDIFEDENLFKITILSENDEKGKPGTKHEEGAKQAMVSSSYSVPIVRLQCKKFIPWNLFISSPHIIRFIFLL